MLNSRVLNKVGLCALTAPGAALCYQRIVSRSHQVFGDSNNPNVVIYHPNVVDIKRAVMKSDWDEVANLILTSISELEKCGVDCVAIPVNTVHFSIDKIIKKSNITVFDRLEVVSNYTKDSDYKKVLIIGTNSTTSGLYTERLTSVGVQEIVPDREDCELIHNIIFNHLLPMVDLEIARTLLMNVINRYKSDCDTIVLACTELPLVLNSENCQIPVINTTEVLADAIVSYVEASQN